MAKTPFGSMVREAERQMTRGVQPQSMMGFPGKMPMMEKRKTPPAYGKGGKKGRYQYGKTRIKGYADPLA